MHRKNFLKVQSSIMMKEGYIIKRNADGTFWPTNEFRDNVTESDEKFREQIITFINDAVGDDWAVRFSPFTEDKFDVRIYADSIPIFHQIIQIIKERLHSTSFYDFMWQGPVSNIAPQDEDE
jgi:hypothetical protein